MNKLSHLSINEINLFQTILDYYNNQELEQFERLTKTLTDEQFHYCHEFFSTFKYAGSGPMDTLVYAYYQGLRLPKLSFGDKKCSTRWKGETRI